MKFAPLSTAVSAALLAFAAAPARADVTYTIRYSPGGEYNGAGRQLLFGFFGYDRPNGTFRSLAGFPVTEVRAFVNFTPAAPTLATQLLVALDIPVIPADPNQSPTLLILGPQLVEQPAGSNSYRYSLTTQAFNGLARAGRYELTIDTIEDGMGNFPPLFGVISDDSVIEVDVLAPEDCPADFDDGSGTGVPDGGVGIEDLLYYLSLFESGDVFADLDDGSGTGTTDGGVGIEDLLYFLLRFEGGC